MHVQGQPHTQSTQKHTETHMRLAKEQECYREICALHTAAQMHTTHTRTHTHIVINAVQNVIGTPRRRTQLCDNMRHNQDPARADRHCALLEPGPICAEAAPCDPLGEVG